MEQNNCYQSKVEFRYSRGRSTAITIAAARLTITKQTMTATANDDNEIIKKMQNMYNKREYEQIL